MKAALRLFLVRGLGLRSANMLIRHFKETERVFGANSDELEALGIPPEIAEEILSPKSAERAETEAEKAEKLGVTLMDILDPRYPPFLREIFDPPIVLYVRGKKWNAELPQVAIVGTRRPTGYGLNCAERLAEDLAARGLAVTSGLARGLDAAAHRGALRAGITFAVFGSGVDFVYPKENRELADFVEENGAIIAEFRLGTPPSPQNFPIRNRIIAGMSLGVTVVEAAEYSGSLITVRLALEAGREIFAVPGSITSPKSFRTPSARKFSRRSWQKCRLCLSRSSTARKRKSGGYCRCRKQCRLIPCSQSCHYPRPKFIVRCLLWRWLSTSGNCLERNIFAVFET